MQLLIISSQLHLQLPELLEFLLHNYIKCYLLVLLKISIFQYVSILKYLKWFHGSELTHPPPLTHSSYSLWINSACIAQNFSNSRRFRDHTKSVCTTESGTLLKLHLKQLASTKLTFFLWLTYKYMQNYVKMPSCRKFR